jgi:hypothetical protein
MNERIMVALNKSEDKVSLDLDIPSVYNTKRAINLVTNEEIKIVNNKLPITLNGLSWGIYKLD